MVTRVMLLRYSFLIWKAAILAGDLTRRAIFDPVYYQLSPARELGCPCV